MKAAICDQIEFFLRESSVSAAQLARASGVHEVFISRLKRGVQKDTNSAKADALREAMKILDPDAAEKALR